MVLNPLQFQEHHFSQGLLSNDFCWGTPGLTGSCHIHMMDRVAANDKTFFGRLTFNHFHGPNLLTQSNALATVITLH